jgi:hypothetical protein
MKAGKRHSGCHAIILDFHIHVAAGPTASHAGLYESPVMSVSRGTGFHPFVVQARRDGGYWVYKAAIS